MANGADLINKYLISKGITPTQGDKFPLFDVRKDLYSKLGLDQSLGTFVGNQTQNTSMLNQLQKAEQNTGVNINPNNLGNFTSMVRQGLQNFTGQVGQGGQVGQTVSTGGAGQTLDAGAGAGGVNPNMGTPIFPENPTEGMRVSLGPGKASYRYDGATNQWMETSMYDAKHGTTGGAGDTGGVGGAGDTTGGDSLAGQDATGLLPEIPTGDELASLALEQVQNSATFPLQMEAQEAQKSAVKLGAQRETQDFIKNIASRGLFFSGAKSEGVSNIEVDKLASLLNIDRSFAMLMAQGLETAAQDIAKEAAKGRTEAIDALASLGFAINPLNNKVEPTLQARQVVAQEGRAQAKFEREETEAATEQLSRAIFPLLTSDPAANSQLIKELSQESGIPEGTLIAELNELQRSDQRDQLQILKLEADLANATDPLDRRLKLAQIAQAEANVAKTIQATSGTSDVRQLGGVNYTPDPNLSQGQFDKIGTIETGLKFVDQAERLYEQGVGEEYEGIGSGIWSRLKGLTRFIGVTTGTNESFAIYERFLDSNRATIAKGIKGEVGNLAKDEQKNALKSFPGKFSSPAEAKAAFENIRSQMTNQLDALGTFDGEPQFGGVDLEDDFNKFISQ